MKADRVAIRAEGAPATKGYTPAIRVGDLLFVSGQVAFDENGKVVGEGDCRAQTEQTLRNLEAVLRAAGASLSDVVKTTNYLVDRADYAVFNETRQRFFPADAPPASASVFVAGLVRPELLVEIDAIAVIR